MAHNCSMCPYFGSHHERLMSHLLRKHRDDPNFIIHCNFSGCGVSYRNYLSFKKHVFRTHASVNPSINQPHTYEECIELENVCDNIENVCDNIENEVAKSEAAFLLKLEVKHNVSQSGIADIMESVNTLFASKMHHENETAQSTVTSRSTPDNWGTDVTSHMFSSLDTQFKRNKFFESNFDLIMPIAVKKGEKIVTKKVNRKQKLVKVDVNVDVDVVPFLKQLESLLSMPEVVEILNTESDEPDFVQNVAQGAYVSNHELLLQHRHALLFSTYNDDYEVVNPIGSHRKKHKQCIFYWQLLNIPPEYQSKLSSMQLLACAKSADVKKFGLQQLLSDFNTGLKKLHDGVQLKINGSSRLHHGLLVCVLGDTLAAQALGGFKEGVGTANRPCRTCEVSSKDMAKIRTSDNFVLRDEREHRDRVEMLSQLTEKTRNYWSREWGINKTSVFSEIPSFCLMKCFLHDPMHILLEGVDKLAVKWLLYRLILMPGFPHYLTLAELNAAILNYPYMNTDALDKPKVIERSELLPDSSLTQSAASMRVLLFALPFLIGHYIADDNEHWMILIRLLQINILCFSPIVSYKTVCSLHILIAAFNSSFVELYPSAPFIPKMHYMTHLPDQLRLFGPLRHHSCTRFEAKHGFIKNKKWRNFKAL